MKEKIKEKLESAKDFLKVCKFLSTMNPLNKIERENLEKRIKEKLESAESFFKTCEAISKNPRSETEKENFDENYRLPCAKTCYFLNAIIFELLIKIFYEKNRNESSEKIHNLKKIYGKLCTETQDFIKCAYNELKKNVEREIAVAARQQQNINITYCDLNEALSHNGDIVTNFKYQQTFNKKNSVFSVVIKPELVITKPKDKEIIYVVPYHIYSSFFEKLFKKIKPPSSL